jgi:hypothetical protein
MSLITLEEEFTGKGKQKGYNFKQLYVSENVYMYEKRHEQGGLMYEVFERRKSPVCIDFEKRIYSETDFKETYPKAEAFGNWAWTTGSLKKACKYFNEFFEKGKAKLERPTLDRPYKYTHELEENDQPC